MSNKVIQLNCSTIADIPPDRILQAAIGQVDEVMVIGWDKSGRLYGASSTAKIGDMLHLLELCKMDLLSGDD